MHAAVTLPERADIGMCICASHITVYWKYVWKAAFSKVEPSLHKHPISKRERGWFFWQELCEAPAHRPSTILSVQRGENQSVRFDDVIFSTFP